MKTYEYVQLAGVVEFTRLCVASGRVISKHRQENLVVNNGYIYTALRFCKAQPLLNVIAAGTGTIPADATDTALGAQTSIDNNIFGPNTGSGLDASKIFMTGALLGDNWAGTITEAGLFSDTILFSRIVLTTPQVINPGEVVQVDWSILFSGAP